MQKKPLSSYYAFTIFLIFCSSLLFTFWGEIYLQGDDIYIYFDFISKAWDISFFEIPFIKFIQRRLFLIYFYREIFQFFNNSPTLTMIFFLSFAVGSSLLLWKTLSKFFSKKAALLAALFFLSYLGKEGVMNRLQGGLYHAVVFIGILCAYLSTKNFKSDFIKYLLITLLLNFSYLMYEILIIFTPMFIIFKTWAYFQKNNSFSFKAVFPSCIPFIGALVHIGILATSSNPIWNRIPDKALNQSVSIKRIFDTFKWGLDLTIGSKYWNKLLSSLQFFFKEIIPSHPSLILWIALLLTLTLFLIFRVKNNSTKFESELSNKNYALIFICVFILMGIAPLVSITTVTNFVPPRFAYTSGVFLSVLFCLTLSFKPKNNKWSTFISFSLALWLVAQTVAFASHSKQTAIAGEFDTKTENTILELFPDLEEDDALILSFPENIDPKVSSAYSKMTPVYLSNDYRNMLLGHYSNLKIPPRIFGFIQGSQREKSSFRNKLLKWSAQSAHQVYFLILDNQFKAKYFVTKAQLISKKTIIVELNFKTPAQYKNVSVNQLEHTIKKNPSPEFWKFFATKVQ